MSGWTEPQNLVQLSGSNSIKCFRIDFSTRYRTELTTFPRSVRTSTKQHPDIKSIILLSTLNASFLSILSKERSCSWFTGEEIEARNNSLFNHAFAGPLPLLVFRVLQNSKCFLFVFSKPASALLFNLHIFSELNMPEAPSATFASLPSPPTAYRKTQVDAS